MQDSIKGIKVTSRGIGITKGETDKEVIKHPKYELRLVFS